MRIVIRIPNLLTFENVMNSIKQNEKLRHIKWVSNKNLNFTNEVVDYLNRFKIQRVYLIIDFKFKNMFFLEESLTNIFKNWNIFQSWLDDAFIRAHHAIFFPNIPEINCNISEVVLQLSKIKNKRYLYLNHSLKSNYFNLTYHLKSKMMNDMIYYEGNIEKFMNIICPDKSKESYSNINIRKIKV